MPSTPLFTLDLQVDEIQTEKISIFSGKDIQPKLSHFFKNYGINNPDFKKKIFQRVTRFFDYLQNQNLFDKPMYETNSKDNGMFPYFNNVKNQVSKKLYR